MERKQKLVLSCVIANLRYCCAFFFRGVWENELAVSNNYSFISKVSLFFVILFSGVELGYWPEYVVCTLPVILFFFQHDLT
jgi:hypothetical protein